MRAFFRFCKFQDRGVECRNAPMDGSRACGCTSDQMDICWRPGMSQSHIRKIKKQIASRNALPRLSRTRARKMMTLLSLIDIVERDRETANEHESDCICMACREKRVSSINPHGWPIDDPEPLTFHFTAEIQLPTREIVEDISIDAADQAEADTLAREHIYQKYSNVRGFTLFCDRPSDDPETRHV